MDLRHAALTCMANICVRISGQPPLDDGHKSVCFSLFLQTLQVPRPDDGDELFYCIVSIERLVDFGSVKSPARLLTRPTFSQRLMFQGTPGVSVTWPAVLYPAPLSHYESPSARKPEDEAPKPPEAAKDGGGKATAVRRRTSSMAKPNNPFPSTVRLRHARVRQGALHCLLAVVKWVEKRTLYGYWSSFIPEAPVGNGAAPPLTLLTIILKDPSPKVRMCALQALSAMLDGSRQFLAVAEDTASPRTSYTPFSFTLATAVRELHRSLSLALMAETSPHTLTQVIKCLAHLVSNAPYHRLRPGLLSSLWKQIRPYVRHRDTNVRVSALTLYGALVTTQAPLPEVQLLLQQPEGSSASGGGGSFTPQDSRALSWRQPGDTPSPRAPRTPKEAEGGPPWLLTLCAALVTQPRDEHSDSEGVGGLALEPSPVRLEALQDKMQLMCITVLLGLTYSDSDLVKMAAVRALGVYVLFPCLREDLMFVADTANSILAALDDRSSNIRAKAAWSLGNLTDTLLVNMDCVEVDFQKEMSDMLLLKMLQAATRSAADKDKVKCNAVRAIGNLLHFLREAQLSRAAFRQPLEDAMRALVKTVQSVATMKVRWNACYALGKAFKNPDLPLESACWSGDALAALCNVVGSCKNFKVRIKSAAALAVPAHRRCYGDAERFGHVWRSLAAALRSSEETDDFLEYRYSASLRHTLSRALLHLLRLGLPSDLPAISASLAGEEGGGLREHLLKYLRAEGVPGEEKDAAAGDTFDPQQRVQSLQQMVQRLKAMEVDTEESAKAALICFLEDLLKDSEEP
uniref:HEAT repeat-containing protein 6 n=1 Tax=Hippocampus comes TaxID=109280 RepID=A0A3Q2YTK1_HIPCM